MRITLGHGLVIRHNRKGRAVYAAQWIPRGMIVHECTMLVYPPGQKPDRFAMLYVWEWKLSRRAWSYAICLGIGSLFNHSPKPNTGSARLYKSRKMVFTALRDIARGEEILVNYEAGATAFKVLP